MRTPTTIFLAIYLLAVAGLSLVPAFAALSVSTSQASYFTGQSISITGSGATPGQAVSIQVIDPNGTIKGVDQTVANATGAFSKSNFFVLPTSPTGTWSVKVAQGGSTATASFTVLPSESVPPTITVASLDKTVVKGGTELTVTVIASDESGISSVTAGAVQLTLSAGVYTGKVTAASTEGPQGILVTVRDAVGNIATRSLPYTVDNTPPTITITSPVSGSKIETPSVTVTGTVTDNIASASQIDVTVNGFPVTLGAGGTLSHSVTLSVGVNTITVVATDQAGNSRTSTVTVTFTPGAPAPTAGGPQLVVQVSTPSIAYAGETVQIWVLTSFNGTYTTDVSFNIPTGRMNGPGIPHMHAPDGSVTPLTMNKMHNGLYQATVTMPIQVGTYEVVVPVLANGVVAVSSSSIQVTNRVADVSSINKLATEVANLRTSVDNLLGAVQSAQANILGSINAANADLKASLAQAERNIGNAVSSAQSSLAATLGTVGSAAQAAQTAANNIRSDLSKVADNLNSVNQAVASSSTFVLVVAVLAAITLILQLVIVVRRL